MAEKKRSKKKVETIYIDSFAEYRGPELTGIVLDEVNEPTPEPEPIASDPVTIRTVGSTHNYTLLEHVDAVRGAFKYQVVNEKNGTTHDFESISQAVQYLHDAKLR